MSWKIRRDDERYYVDAYTMPGAQKALRLAAAAPDLLEALEATVSLLEKLGHFPDNSLTVAAAREAIANAK
jgi:hypothetical protein